MDPDAQVLSRQVAAGGAAIFTTHGERSIGLLARDPADVQVISATCGGWTGDYGVGDAAAAMVARAREAGFAFERYAWDESGSWGVSVSTAGWVRATVEAAGGLELAHHVPQGWFEHQDVWTFTRSR